MKRLGKLLLVLAVAVGSLATFSAGAAVEVDILVVSVEIIDPVSGSPVQGLTLIQNDCVAIFARHVIAQTNAEPVATAGSWRIRMWADTNGDGVNDKHIDGPEVPHNTAAAAFVNGQAAVEGSVNFCLDFAGFGTIMAETVEAPADPTIVDVNPDNNRLEASPVRLFVLPDLLRPGNEPRGLVLQLPAQAGKREVATTFSLAFPSVLTFGTTNSGLRRGTVEIVDAQGAVLFHDVNIARGGQQAFTFVTPTLPPGNYNLVAEGSGPPDASAMIATSMAVVQAPPLKDVVVDFDGDGIWDVLNADTDNDGDADLQLFNTDDDLTANGFADFDVVQSDTNNDGFYDTAIVLGPSGGFVDLPNTAAVVPLPC